MIVGRAAVHRDGFASDPAFQQDGESLVKTADADDTYLVYDGNSQGGIMGGALVALSPDISRGILGVLGMNYSTLLNRSVDWEGSLDEVVEDPEGAIDDLADRDVPFRYSAPFYEAYRDPVERQIIYNLMQMLWDRGEANGYAHHLTTDPYENTPPHEVMLQAAFSDHQVANVSAEVEARTIGAPLMTGLPDGRHWARDPFIDIAAYPHRGSALIYWDSGNATPPNGNLPPSQGDDPHGHPRDERAASWQEARFLLTGEMYDVCQGGDYLTRRHPDNGGTRSCIEPDFPAWGQPPTPTPTPTASDPTPTPTASATGEPTPSATPTPVGPERTTLEFTGTKPSGQFSDEVTFAARLIDEQTEPVPGQDITFDLISGDGTRSFTATTDQGGVAQVTTTLTEKPGAAELTAHYDGSDDYQASATRMGYVVEKEDTEISLEVQGRGRQRTLIARLADADGGTGIAGRTIDFAADGTAICRPSPTTDSSGKATCSPPGRYGGGPHSYEASFDEDDYYLKSEAEQRTNN